MKDVLIFDIETVREPWDGRIMVNGWAWGRDGAVETSIGVTDEFKGWLADPNIIKVAHSTHDHRFNIMQGTEINGPFHNTMVMAWILNENTPLNLEWLTKRYTGVIMDKRISQKNNEPWFKCDDGTLVPLEDAPLDQLRAYNVRDVEAQQSLYYTLWDKMEASAWDVYFEEEQVPFSELLLKMETRGMPIDLEAAANLKAELEPEMEAQAAKLGEVLGYELPKWGSNDAVREVLFSKTWRQKDRVEHGLDLRKPTLVNDIVAGTYRPDLSIPPVPRTKSSVTDEEVEELKSVFVKQATPQGFIVEKVSHKFLTGYWLRRGYGLEETPPTQTSKDAHAEDPSVPLVPSVTTPDLLTYFPTHPFVVELVKWRKLRKVITTYLNTYPKQSHNGRLYGRFNQTGTKTGRLSSSGPNLQNQPAHGDLGKRIRSLFRGNLVVGDYSQLEPRLLAHYSQDPVLLQAYHDKVDVYALTAAGIFGGSYRDYPEDSRERKLSKPLFLGDQYGAGYKKLWGLLRVAGFDVTKDEVKKFQSRLHSTYSVATAWKEGVIAEAHRKGYVTTLDGHRRRLSVSLRDRSWKNRGYGERQAVNARIQGSAGDVVRRCMLAADREFGDLLATLAQVHDEVIWEYLAHNLTRIDKLMPDLQEIMETGHGFDLTVPLVFEPGFARTWADKGVDIRIEELLDETEEDA